MLLVLSGPSGAGKSTLARRLASADSRIWRSVSMTTRAPREGERNGIDYIFVTREEFARAIEKGEMLEYAEVHGELYGTPRAPVADRLLQGRDVLLVIDVQGGMQIRRAAPDAVLIFVLPPSRAALEARLRERGSEDERVLRMRLKTADAEVAMARKYDYLVINDDLDRAVAELLAVASAERNRTSRRSEIPW